MFNIRINPQLENLGEICRAIGGRPDPIILMVGPDTTDVALFADYPWFVFWTADDPPPEEIVPPESVAIIFVHGRASVKVWKWIRILTETETISPPAYIFHSCGAPEPVEMGWYSILRKVVLYLKMGSKEALPMSQKNQGGRRAYGAVPAFVRERAVFFSDKAPHGAVAEHVRWLCALGNALSDTNLHNLKEAQVRSVYNIVRKEKEKDPGFKFADDWQWPEEVSVGSTTVKVEQPVRQDRQARPSAARRQIPQASNLQKPLAVSGNGHPGDVHPGATTELVLDSSKDWEGRLLQLRDANGSLAELLQVYTEGYEGIIHDMAEELEELQAEVNRYRSFFEQEAGLRIRLGVAVERPPVEAVVQT